MHCLWIFRSADHRGGNDGSQFRVCAFLSAQYSRSSRTGTQTMKKLLLIIAVSLSLSGCANFQNAWGIVTGATVSPTAVYIARNSFDALEATATNYISYCK